MKFLALSFLLGTLPVYAQHNHHDHASHAGVKRKSVSAQEKKLLEEVLAKNDILFNALLKKDNDLIEKSAQSLKKTLDASKSEILKEVKSQSSQLSLITKKNKNEDNLAAYEAFLNPLIKVVKENDVGAKYNIFSCPMVKKSWVQDISVNKGVKNVYAMEMLECGTQDTHYK